MIIDEARCLHECVAYSWTDESESVFFEWLSHRFWDISEWRAFAVSRSLICNSFISHETPYICIETSMFFDYCLKCKSILSHSCYLELVLDDVVFHHSCEKFFVGSLDNLLHIEIPEHLAICVASIQNCFPWESCLSSLKTEKFKKLMIIIYRFPPFGIMIGDIEWVFHIDPATTVRSIHEGEYIVLGGNFNVSGHLEERGMCSVTLELAKQSSVSVMSSEVKRSRDISVTKESPSHSQV